MKLLKKTTVKIQMKNIKFDQKSMSIIKQMDNKIKLASDKTLTKTHPMLH